MKVSVINEDLFQATLNRVPGWSKHNSSEEVLVEGGSFGKILHVMICSDDEIPIYDQILRTEPCGGVFLSYFFNEEAELLIWLQQVWRP